MNISGKTKKILIINVHSSDNAGDLALLQQTIFYLQSAFGKVKITICSNWPDEKQIIELGYQVVPSPWQIIGVWDKNKKPRYQVLSFLCGVFYFFYFKFYKSSKLGSAIPENWKNLFYTYFETDLIVAVSGNQLFSSGKFGWPLPVVGFPIYLAIHFKKPIIIFPQSVGPFKYYWEKKFVSYLYDRVNKLFIRDLVSLDLVKKIGIKNSNPQFMPDIAFTYPAIDKKYAIKILSSYGYSTENKNIGITILSKMPSYIDRTQIENYYGALSETITKLILIDNYNVFIFNQVVGPTEDENDLIGAKNVISLLPTQIRKKIIIIHEKLSPSELKGCYGLMDLFLATRLHSGIFALEMRVPTLFIGYLDKTIGILKSIDLDKYFIKLDEVTSEILTKKLIEMEIQQEKLISFIDDKMNSIGVLLLQFPEIIRETISDEKN